MNTNEPIKPIVAETMKNVQSVASNIGWGPLAGLGAIYLAHIRQMDKQAGTAPSKTSERHVGRDYEW